MNTVYLQQAELYLITPILLLERSLMEIKLMKFDVKLVMSQHFEMVSICKYNGVRCH